MVHAYSFFFKKTDLPAVPTCSVPNLFSKILAIRINAIGANPSLISQMAS